MSKVFGKESQVTQFTARALKIGTQFQMWRLWIHVIKLLKAIESIDEHRIGLSGVECDHEEEGGNLELFGIYWMNHND